MKNKNKKLISVLCLLALVIGLVLPSFNNTDTKKVYEDTEAGAPLAAGDVRISSRFYEILFGEEEYVSTAAVAEERPYLIPGGDVFGIKIKGTGLTVTEADSSLGLVEGDRLISVNGARVDSMDSLREWVRKCDGKTMQLCFKRGSKTIERDITPEKIGGEWRLGILLRDGAAGIGTVTYIDKNDGSFGGLGHGICEPDSHTPVKMSEGKVTGVILGGAHKGEAGKPGELSGVLNDKDGGVLYSNTECGVFGKLNIKSEVLKSREAYPIAYKNEVKVGKAQIISTVKNGKKAFYDIEITELSPSAEGTKCLKLHVTDEALLALTGGIVKGMSGSPIIQDGKLVGAVTHVMVANPTEGYGIFIENMLSASESAVPKAA